MEVPHPKTPRKKAGHVLFEFFMLFLAISLGFYVDNLREHYVDNHREKVYMRMLSNDIKADIAEIERIRTYRTVREFQLDSLFQLLTGPAPADKVKEIYRLTKLTDSYESFFRNDRTIQQLKTAGGMRIIRNDSVSDAIMAYDNFIIAEIDWNNRTEASRIDYYKQQRYQLYDARSLNASANNDTTWHLVLLPATPLQINLVSGALLQVKRISETSRESGEEAIKKARELLHKIETYYPTD